MASTTQDPVTFKTYDGAGNVIDQRTVGDPAVPLYDDSLPPGVNDISELPAYWDSLAGGDSTGGGAPSLWDNFKQSVAGVESGLGSAAETAVAGLTKVILGVGVVAGIVLLVVYAPEVKGALHLLKRVVK